MAHALTRLAGLVLLAVLTVGITTTVFVDYAYAGVPPIIGNTTHRIYR